MLRQYRGGKRTTHSAAKNSLGCFREFVYEGYTKFSKSLSWNVSRFPVAAIPALHGTDALVAEKVRQTKVSFQTSHPLHGLFRFVKLDLQP
jgi:hypothetical protein